MKHRIIYIFLMSFCLSPYLYANNLCHNNKSDLKILAWSYQAMMATYNYNFAAYQHNFATAKKYYTPTAWNDYYKDFAIKNMQQQVVNHKWVVSVGTDNTPILVKKSDKFWQVELPLLIHFQNANQQKLTKMTVLMDINPSNTATATDCLVITKIQKK